MTRDAVKSFILDGWNSTSNNQFIRQVQIVVDGVLFTARKSWKFKQAMNLLFCDQASLQCESWFPCQ